MKEQRKLKQSQTKLSFSGGPAYVSVPPPAKSQHMGLGPQPTPAPSTASAPASAPAQPSAPATTSTGIVALTQRSSNVVRLPPGSTLTPRQGLLLSAHQLESSLGWEALPMHTLSGNSFGSDKQFAMDWASADGGKVSSQRTTSIHPSSGSMVAKTLHELQIATLKASQTATVSSTNPNCLP